MKITIDLAQSPIQLRDDLNRAVRFALGGAFYIEESDHPNDPPANFTPAELADPVVNIPNVQTAALPNALPVVNAGAQLAGAETDSAGDIWDVRIHSGGKSKIANGTWKLAKGMSTKADYVAQINAQNRQLRATPLPTAAPTLTVVPNALPTLPPVVAALPELPPVAPIALPDVELVVSDYPTFAQFVAQQMVAKPVAAKRELDKGLTHYGMVDANGAPDITALQHRADVVMPLYGWFKAVVDLCTE